MRCELTKPCALCDALYEESHLPYCDECLEILNNSLRCSANSKDHATQKAWLENCDWLEAKQKEFLSFPEIAGLLSPSSFKPIKKGIRCDQVNKIVRTMAQQDATTAMDDNCRPWAQAYHQEENTKLCFAASALLKKAEYQHVKKLFDALLKVLQQRILLEKYPSLYILYNAYIDVLCRYGLAGEAVGVFKVYYGNSQRFLSENSKSTKATASFDFHGLSYYSTVIALIAVITDWKDKADQLCFIVGRHGKHVVAQAVLDTIKTMGLSKKNGRANAGLITISSACIPAAATSAEKEVTLREITHKKTSPILFLVNAEEKNTRIVCIQEKQRAWKEILGEFRQAYTTVKVAEVENTETEKRSNIHDDWETDSFGRLTSAHRKMNQLFLQEQERNERQALEQVSSWQIADLALKEGKFRDEIHCKKINEKAEIAKKAAIKTTEKIFLDRTINPEKSQRGSILADEQKEFKEITDTFEGEQKKFKEITDASQLVFKKPQKKIVENENLQHMNYGLKILFLTLLLRTLCLLGPIFFTKDFFMPDPEKKSNCCDDTTLEGYVEKWNPTPNHFR